MSQEIGSDRIVAQPYRFEREFNAQGRIVETKVYWTKSKRKRVYDQRTNSYILREGEARA